LPRRIAYGRGTLYAACSEVHAEQRVRFTTQNRRYEFSSADVANFANMQLTPYIAALVGYDLLPIYAFPVVYLQGGGIEPHRDVSENEISLSMQVRLTSDGTRRTPQDHSKARPLDLNGIKHLS
jgi:hypothetical protein